MKKILIILSFSLFASSNLFAESFKLNQFNLWLYENGYHQYLTMKENPVCKEEPKYSNLNSYQWDIVHHYLNIEKKPFGSASWTVVEPNCHFTK